MVANVARFSSPSRSYIDGSPYRLAQGRYAPRGPVVDRLANSHAVVELDREQLAATDFLRRIVREMRIRFYLPKTIKLYRNALAGFLRWLARRPDQATREDVREYLLYLVEARASSSWVSAHDPDGVRTALVTIGIEEQPRTVFLTGIVAREVRPGWISLEVPPLERWEEPLRWLNPSRRDRVEQPEFFEMLQREIPRRFRQLMAAA